MTEQPSNATWRTKALVKFAEHTLKVLEAHDEWNACTLDVITSLAYVLKLAEVDDDSKFKRTL